jgi:hypothetical protein
MADKTIRFITAWNGYKPGDTLTDDEAITDELVAGGLATEDLVGPIGSYATVACRTCGSARRHGVLGLFDKPGRTRWPRCTCTAPAPRLTTPTARHPPRARASRRRGDLFRHGRSGFVYRNSGSQAEPIWTKLADAA